MDNGDKLSMNMLTQKIPFIRKLAYGTTDFSYQLITNYYG
ncbi:hypothetical protein WDC_0671 [Paucilactobacillus wasatchensis]|uniref:Uncharacterized protein n=1 Tax=Paucilactobacillus wasatchensis TaxID=1335616 RepID=A0A0D0Y653_9LACO|nr:hypothetical protein WDC_0671 [Paucilactobacillus wasatchensis]